MYFNRFDICEAYFLFFSHYHSGQSSKLYKRLSKMSGYFKPRHNLSIDTLEDNALEIYLNLVEKVS